MKDFEIRNGSVGDIERIVELYRDVASIEGGLARTADEVTHEYVAGFVENAALNGVIVVATEPSCGKLIGEIHGYGLGPKVFSHVIGELTIAVHPDAQGIGVGKALFTEFMRVVRDERLDILRVELIARESNAKAIEFYKKLGFVVEGRLTGRIRSVGGGFEADIPMAWHRG